jgi:hypothetical protein
MTTKSNDLDNMNVRIASMQAAKRNITTDGVRHRSRKRPLMGIAGDVQLPDGK